MVFLRSHARSALETNGNANNNSHTPNTTHSTSEETNTNIHNQNTRVTYDGLLIKFCRLTDVSKNWNI